MSEDRHYLERELYELIQRDESIFDFLQLGSLDGLWYWDIEAPENEWLSPRFWEVLGFDPSARRHLAAEWQDLIFGDDLQVALSNFRKHCENPSHPYDQVVRYRHKDGSTVWIRCRGIAIRDEAGNPVRMLGAHTDLTAQKTAEETLQRRTLELEAANEKLEKALEEVTRLSDRLHAENIYLRDEIRSAFDPSRMIGESEPMRNLSAHIEQVAASEVNVLIVGETGTGKELVARSIHAASRRSKRPLVKVDCAALTPSLIESELFGHEKGAFTGATSRRPGRFELADGGTIFLDEIGELAPHLQAKLLRVLQDGDLERVGSNQTLNVDVRVIAATNRDLETARQEGRFRDDLFYRLNVFPICVPPLRDRREDIPLLTWYFAGAHATRYGKLIEQIGDHTMRELVRRDWPGNVRELRNTIERAVIVSTGPELRIDASGTSAGTAAARNDDVSGGPAPAAPADEPPAKPAEPSTLADVERAHIRAALKRANWKLSGPRGAAEKLGLKEATLRYRMKKHGIQRPR